MDRTSWDTYFMNLAYVISERSTCIRRQVGAVAVKDKRIIATGYNGAPPNVPHCTKQTCIRTIKNIPSGERIEVCFAVHSEQNLIVQAARFGLSLDGCIVYCTHMPCFTCAKLLYSVGVRQIHYADSYPDSISEEFLASVSMRVSRLHGFKKPKIVTSLTV